MTINMAEEQKSDLIIDRLISGKSSAATELKRLMKKVAPTSSTALILGPTGSGKELVAKGIHEFSGRKGPLISVNCAAIPTELLESELFGHEKGSFTGADKARSGKFELSSGGSLFLDEIGDMPFSAQTRLLRVLQEKEFTPIGSKETIKTNARIISASQNHLDQMVEEGLFRKDLYFRLNVIPIFVPPLRERKTDISLLINHFLNKIKDEGLPKKFFSDKALSVLEDYSWPGNIRELENFIKRLSILNSEQEISSDVVKKNLQKNHRIKNKVNKNNGLNHIIESKFHEHIGSHNPNFTPHGLYNLIVSEIEKPLIEVCLKFTNGNQHKAAELLGINRNTLRKKIKELNILIHR